MVRLSVIVPLFNEEAVVPQLVDRLVNVLGRLPAETEVVFVNDGSTDGTGRMLADAVAQHRGFLCVELSRNFGHQAAITAGLMHAAGGVVAVMDGDLQDPPELIPLLFENVSQGYDVAYAVRESRKEGLIKRAAYHLFYRVMNRTATISLPLDAGDFCAMSRRVVDEMKRMPERRRYLRGLRSYAGFRQIGVPYARDARAAGDSRYTISGLFRLAGDGLFTFSDAPLRVASFVGWGVALFCIAYAAYLLVWRLTSAAELPGFATLAVAVFFLGAVQLICLGILGEYVARIHAEVKGRPVFVVDRVIRNGEGPASPSL